jgi:hypothetical protein
MPAGGDPKTTGRGRIADMLNTHPEFDVVITQMQSLEALYLSETPDKPIVAKDLLTICEAIRTLAAKMSTFAAEPAEEAGV